MPADSHGASSRYDPYLTRNAPLNLSPFMRFTQRAGTFFVNQVQKLQDGRPTVKNNDRWNEAIAFTPWSWQRRRLGTRNRVSNFNCSRGRSCLLTDILWRSGNAFDITKILSLKQVIHSYCRSTSLTERMWRLSQACGTHLIQWLLRCTDISDEKALSELSWL